MIGDLGAFYGIGILIIREAELSVLRNPVLFISRVDNDLRRSHSVASLFSLAVGTSRFTI